MNYMKDTLEVMSKLPEALVKSASKTLEFIDKNPSEMHRAMFWQTVALAFHHGEQKGLQKSFNTFADTLEKLGKEEK